MSRVSVDLSTRYSTERAAFYVNLLKPNGSWPDISYRSDSGIGEWQAVAHLDRVLSIAIDIRSSSSVEVKERSIRAVNSALAYWESSTPVTKNWWYSDIGIPLKLVQIAVAMEKNVIPIAVKMARESMVKVPSIRRERDQGQNFIWYREIAILNALFVGDLNTLEKAVRDVRSSLKRRCDSSDGIKPDLSFHQHGGVFYSGAYGLNYLFDLSRISFFFSGTKFAFSDDDSQLLIDYLLDGVAPLIRGGWLDWSARGREFVRKGAAVRAISSVRQAAYYLQRISPYRNSDIRAFIERIDSKKYGNDIGGVVNRYFPYSDFVVHQNRDVYFSVKLCAEGGIGGESFNGENEWGYWLPYGATYALVKGEYINGALSVYDWTKIPGVTGYSELRRITGLVQCPAIKTVGVSDTKSGVVFADMEYSNLRLKKAWFFDEAMMVVVGRGLSGSTNAGLITTLFQVEAPSDMKIDGKTLDLPSKPPSFSETGRTIQAAGLIYAFKKTMRFHFNTSLDFAKNAGRGQARKIVVSAWIDHGDDPSLSDFDFVVLPISDWSGNTEIYEVLRTDAEKIVIFFPKSNKYMVALSSPSELRLERGRDVLMSTTAPAVAIYSYDHAQVVTGTVAFSRGRPGRVDLSYLSGGAGSVRKPLPLTARSLGCGMPSAFDF